MMAKLLQFFFSRKRKKEKKSDFESIGGYLLKVASGAN